MAFVKNLAKGGLFGLSGLAATGAFDGNKKPKPQPTLLTQGQPQPSPSLINSKPTIY
jgi:hypothetical protein